MGFCSFGGVKRSFHKSSHSRSLKAAGPCSSACLCFVEGAAKEQLPLSFRFSLGQRTWLHRICCPIAASNALGFLICSGFSDRCSLANRGARRGWPRSRDPASFWKDPQDGSKGDNRKRSDYAQLGSIDLGSCITPVWLPCSLPSKA